MFRKLILLSMLFASLSASANDFKFFKALSGSKEYGLMYVFSAQCPHCQKMVPVIKQIQNQYDIDIFAIAQNGIGLGSLQDVVPLTKDIASKYFPNGQVMFPYLALQQLNGDMQVYPVGVGETTANKLLNILDKYSKNILLGDWSNNNDSGTYMLEENN